MIRKAKVQVRRWVEKLLVVVAGMVVPALCWCPMPASALHATNADTIFNAYNNAFYYVSGGSGYYKDDTTGGQTWFWGQAEEIEMAIDHYDRTESATTRTMLSALCTGFLNRNGTDWTWNEYNDDIAWAVIAFCRTYQITGNTTFQDRAKANLDAMCSRCRATNLVLSWSGGIAPYDVLMATNVASPAWQPVQSSLAATNVTVNPTNPAAFYRVRGQ